MYQVTPTLAFVQAWAAGPSKTVGKLPLPPAAFHIPSSLLTRWTKHVAYDASEHVQQRDVMQGTPQDEVGRQTDQV